ncbi:hypothetical protein GYH30_017055 [Glycine max]|nr:hypothetical protein GYH30_017055 [Glycine max]
MGAYRNLKEAARKHGKVAAAAASSNEPPPPPPPGERLLRCKCCNAEFDCSNALREHEKFLEEEMEEECRNSSTLPQNESIQRQLGQETSNSSILSQAAQNIIMHQFQSLMAQGISGSSHQPLVSCSAVPVTVQGLPSSSSQPNGNFGQESSSSRRPQNESLERPHFNVNERQFGQERSNSSILPQTQNIDMHPQFQSLMAQGSTGPSHQPLVSSIRPQIASIGSAASHQHHSSYQPLVSSSVTSSSRSHPSLCYEGSSGQESNSLVRPQNASIERRSDKRKFGQESTSSSIRERSPADSNVKRLKPSCDERKFDQSSSSSVIVPQNTITEVEGPQQISSSSTPVNGAQEEEKFDLNLKP